VEAEEPLQIRCQNAQNAPNHIKFRKKSGQYPEPPSTGALGRKEEDTGRRRKGEKGGDGGKGRDGRGAEWIDFGRFDKILISQLIRLTTPSKLCSRSDTN